MMKLKLIAAAAAALFMSTAAQAQKQEWYLMGADDTNTALVFVERFSVINKGDQATANTLILRVNDAKGEEFAVLTALAFDCKARSFKIVHAQPLDLEGNTIGDGFDGNSEPVTVERKSFYDGAVDFVCGGSATPDPELMVAARPPVAAGAKFLRDRQKESSDQ